MRLGSSWLCGWAGRHNTCQGSERDLDIKDDLIEFPYKGRWQIKKVNINYKKTIMSLRVTKWLTTDLWTWCTWCVADSRRRYRRMDITLLKETEEMETEKSEIIIRGQGYSHDSTKSLCIQSVCQLPAFSRQEELGGLGFCRESFFLWGPLKL